MYTEYRHVLVKARIQNLQQQLQDGNSAQCSLQSVHHEDPVNIILCPLTYFDVGCIGAEHYHHLLLLGGPALPILLLTGK